jgi:hypothetical protein
MITLFFETVKFLLKMQLSVRRAQSTKLSHTEFFKNEEFQQHQSQSLKTLKTIHMRTTKTTTYNTNKKMP